MTRSTTDEGGDDGGSSETIVVGSQAYYSNEIIAEIYAQALEAEGFTVERKFQIGQRDAILPELEAGRVDLVPEYTGNLLQFYSPDTTATESEAVYAELADVLPEGLVVLDQSPATDQDSYNVTKEFADANDVTSIADLAGPAEPRARRQPRARDAPVRRAGASRTPTTWTSRSRRSATAADR